MESALVCFASLYLPKRFTNDAILELRPGTRLRGILPMSWQELKETLAHAIACCAPSYLQRLHARVISSGLRHNLYISSLLITQYFKFGDARTARQVFDALRDRPTKTLLWNSLIKGYLRSGLPGLALDVYREMTGPSLQCKPDKVTFHLAITACTHLSEFELGGRVRDHARNDGLESDLLVGTALVGLYSKAGDLKTAHWVFDRMGHRDVVSWNAMISGYSQAGSIHEAMDLFGKMRLVYGILPTEVTLVSVITGCRNWSLLQGGKNYYIGAARELARMVGIRKAPILHHLSESIAGAATIRCFNQEERFSAKNLTLIDDYSRITFHNSATMEWLSVRINFLFNLVFFLVLNILVSMPKNAINPSLAGLATTYGLNLNVLQAWVIWNLCNVENKMISVERILQYSNTSSEAALVIENCRPKEDWPNCGTIEFDNLQVQYNPGLPVVLRGLSCTFPGGKKIGVVGRTGSGKSTLVQALFRVVEPSLGKIVIDGLDICQIGLHDLRSRLSIIPQEPTLFQGTVRTNLDPMEQHTDLEIWEALRKCRLGEIIKQDQMLLDAPVAEDGENWSVGQRQLFCLGRVLLKKRRILVLDEATASVDTETDSFIQKTIREETSNCTVITVAHRIPTVIDSDLVLVLDEGKILEFNSPGDLLRDKSSAFSKLVMEFLGRSKSNHDSEIY